jgi:NodT family efflux transporter outer membrane factor (OMF) lipoprotein
MASTPAPLAKISNQRLGLSNQKSSWPTTKWWEHYEDPQLNALVTEALTHHPSITAAQARLAQANAMVKQSKAPSQPRLDADYMLTRERISKNYIYPAPLAGSMQSDTRLGLDFSYELDFWGKHRASLQAALSAQQAHDAEAQAARTLLASAIVQSYLNLQNTFAQGEVLKRFIKQYEEILTITRQRFTAGLNTQVEVKQAESELANAKVQLVQFETTLAQLRNQVAMLTGAGPQRGQRLQPTALTAPATPVPTSLPLELLGHRPDIVAVRWRAEAARHNIETARAEFYPNVNLTAFAGFQALGTENLLQGSSYTAAFGPAISLPLFHGGKLNANLASRHAEADIAISDYNQTVLSAVRQVADALDEIRLLHRETSAQQQAYASIEAAYQLAHNRYRTGLGNYLTVLTAQNSLLQQVQRQTDLRFRAYKLNTELVTALGGGYTTDCAPLRPSSLKTDLN